MKLQSVLAMFCAAVASAAPAPGPDTVAGPEAGFAKIDVQLPSGGTITGKSLLGVEAFNAIPFADPPVGPLRLKPPRRFSGTFGKRDGTGIAPACPQMFISRESLGVVGAIGNDLLQVPLLKTVSGQEDCLTVDVQRPAGTKAGAKLPVLFWIYGGGFEFGATNIYDGSSLVAAAAAAGQGQPFVYVAVNYRVAGFGFMPGREMLADGSANIGLLDQRMALEWVADNIAAFGGDPGKVTIWGESAGSISVLDQMLLYDGDATYRGKPLFRGAIMSSGTIVPADPLDCPKGQAVYDKVVSEVGCSDSGSGSGTRDTLACLRAADYTTFLNAVNSVPGIMSYQTLALSYLPRPDGKVLTQSPDKLVAAGRYHAVPMIVGGQEDEGTFFALLTPSLTTVDKAVDYLATYFFQNATKPRLKTLVELYEPALLNGSPFRTGLLLNELYPGFKRIAAILGDLTFTLSRRAFLGAATAANPDVPVWSYLSSYGHGTPFLGTFHASDLLQVFYGIVPNHAARSCRTYYFNFLHNQDPNKGVGRFANWPTWKEAKKLMWFRWPFANDILADDFRSEAADFISENRDILHI